MDNYVKPQIIPLRYSSGESPYAFAALIWAIPILAAAIVGVGGAIWIWVAGHTQLALHTEVALWTQIKLWIDGGE